MCEVNVNNAVKLVEWDLTAAIQYGNFLLCDKTISQLKQKNTPKVQRQPMIEFKNKNDQIHPIKAKAFQRNNDKRAAIQPEHGPRLSELGTNGLKKSFTSNQLQEKSNDLYRSPNYDLLPS